MENEEGCYRLWGAVIQSAIKEQGRMVRNWKTGVMGLASTATPPEFWQPGGGLEQIAEFMGVEPEYLLRLIRKVAG